MAYVIPIGSSPAECAAGLAATADRCGVDEVMILDHSGPDLAAMQYAAAMKMTMK